MSEMIITTIIMTAGTLVASVVAASAAIKVARIKTPTAGPEQRPGALVHDLRPVLHRIALILIFVSLVVGLVVGLSVQNLRTQIARQVMGDLYHFKLLRLFSVTEIRDDEVERPWRPMDKSETTKLSLHSLDSASKRGRDGALRVQVRLDKSGKDYAEVGIDGTDLPEEPVDLITAWVFVERTPDSVAARIEARLVGCTRAEDDRVFSAQGEPVEVRPDEWTLVVLGMSYEAKIKPPPDSDSQPKYVFESANRRLTSLSIIFEAREESYFGPIYVDDVGLYRRRMPN